MKVLAKSLFFTLAMLSLPEFCVASTVAVVANLDISQPYDYTPPPYYGWQNFDPNFTPATLTVGDTLDYTINFLPGQSLSVTDLSMVWAFLYSDASTNVQVTGKISFLDSMGNAILTSNSKTDEEGASSFGQIFDQSDFASIPTHLTFSGIHYVGTFNSSEPPVDSMTLVVPAFFYNTVPEPSTFALVGFGGLLAIRFRRKTA